MLSNKFIIPVLFIFCGLLSYGQIKIGDDVSTIDSSSILELESTSKVLVLTRMTNAQMLSLNPLPGGMVFNTDTDCVHSYNGSNWVSLCDGNSGTFSFVDNNDGTFTIDHSDGSSFTSIDLTGPQGIQGEKGDAGDAGPQGPMGATGIDGNGIASTTDNADGTFTLNFDDGSSFTTSDLTGPEGAGTDVEQEQIVIIANSGQTQFTTPVPIMDDKKIEVYRNGVRIAFTAIDANTIQLESEVTCYQNDNIRIVQIF